MLTSTFDEIQQVIQRAELLGSRQLDNGTQLIGHIPHFAPQAYLHVIYPGLSTSGIEELELAVQREIPVPLRQLLHRTNGLDLFASSLSVHGLRKSCVREGDAAWQPFNMATENTIERPRGADNDWVFFASYRKDGSSAVMRPKNGTVFRCLPPRVKVLEEWPSIDNFLLKEVHRLEGLYDEAGRRIAR